MRVQSLGQEDPLKEEMAAQSSILAWKILWGGELQSMGSQRGAQDRVTKHTHTHTHTHGGNQRSSSAFQVQFFRAGLRREPVHLEVEDGNTGGLSAP